MIGNIHPRDFQDWVAQQHALGTQPVLLDVREPWELAQAHIAPLGVLVQHTPMQQVPHALADMDSEQPIAVLCHHGVRSMHVAHFLQTQGFTKVFNVTGGIDAWSLHVDQQIPVY